MREVDVQVGLFEVEVGDGQARPDGVVGEVEEVHLARDGLPLVGNFVESDVVLGQVEDLEGVQVIPDGLVVGVEADGVSREVEDLQLDAGHEAAGVENVQLVGAQVKVLEIGRPELK